MGFRYSLIDIENPDAATWIAIDSDSSDLEFVAHDEEPNFPPKGQDLCPQSPWVSQIIVVNPELVRLSLA